MSLLIKDATVLTVDPGRTIHRRGAIYIEGGRIVDVGPPEAVVERLGIRSAMGEMIGDADPDRMVKGEFVFDPAANKAQLERARGFAERWHGRADGRITAILAPNMTISSSREQLRQIRALADRM